LIIFDADSNLGMNASMLDNYPTSTYPRGSGNHLSYKVDVG
jgi:hypothetical protein